MSKVFVLNFVLLQMALVRHPTPPPGGSSVDDLTPSATSRPRRSRASLGYPPGNTPIGRDSVILHISQYKLQYDCFMQSFLSPPGSHHTFRSISTCHNSGPIITICRSSITNTTQTGSRAAAGPGSRTESGNGSRFRSGTGDRVSAGIGVDPGSLSQSQSP